MVSLPLLLLLAGPSEASWGDKAPVYISCKEDCEREMCEGPSLQRWSRSQSLADRLVGWTCPQDCSYSCMWRTVQVYGEHGKVPQFHGKWPFLRLWGLQEPVSVFASLLNLATNLYMVKCFTQTISKNAAMYWVWVGYGLTAINAWVWSSIFHVRDTPMTEAGDYFSALGTVLSSLTAFWLRLVPRDTSKQVIITSLAAAFFAHHVYNMLSVSFDYGYNMKVNVGVGGLNCLSWLAWFFLHRHDGPHIKFGLLAVLLVASSVALELLDFAPLYWLLDSHALWHFATVPLPLLWLRFVVPDTILLESEDRRKKKLE